MQKVKTYKSNIVYDTLLFGDKLFVLDRIVGSTEPEVMHWLLSNAVVDTKEVRCYNPFARCYATGMFLFLKKSTLVITVVESRMGKKTDKFYFLPRQYTMWCLKNVS